MFRRRDFDDDPAPLLLGLEPEPALRDEPDPDPLVEAATERLRQQLSALSAVDSWGRVVPWRQVARIALGALATEPEVPDVPEAADGSEVPELLELPDQREPMEDLPDDTLWRTFFRSIDEIDRFLGDQARSLPQR